MRTGLRSGGAIHYLIYHPVDQMASELTNSLGFSQSSTLGASLVLHEAPFEGFAKLYLMCWM